MPDLVVEEGGWTAKRLKRDEEVVRKGTTGWLRASLFGLRGSLASPTSGGAPDKKVSFAESAPSPPLPELPFPVIEAPSALPAKAGSESGIVRNVVEKSAEVEEGRSLSPKNEFSDPTSEQPAIVSTLTALTTASFLKDTLSSPLSASSTTDDESMFQPVTGAELLGPISPLPLSPTDIEPPHTDPVNEEDEEEREERMNMMLPLSISPEDINFDTVLKSLNEMLGRTSTSEDADATLVRGLRGTVVGRRLSVGSLGPEFPVGELSRLFTVIPERKAQPS
ncbi:hypothetical protein HDU67_001673 [Dinochytrium kinnereticum]|nr:hypothetical protein HDU67_001673 [Dinochytrium kinnereticum]